MNRAEDEEGPRLRCARDAHGPVNPAEDEARRLIIEGASALDVPLTPEAAVRLATLVALLRRWNQHINLIGPADLGQAIDRHIHDSLALLRLLDRPEIRDHATSWTDIGSGAGLPGLVLAIARPELDLHLVEPTGKKLAFILEARRRLDIRNAHPQLARLEELEPRSAPAALSRAVFPPERWAERGRHLVHPGGLILVMMAGHPPEKLVRQARWIDRLRLPHSGATRTNAILVAGAPSPPQDPARE